MRTTVLLRVKPIFVMSRRPNKFIPEAWFDLVRLRLPQTHFISNDSGSYPDRLPHSASWKLRSDSMEAGTNAEKRPSDEQGPSTQKYRKKYDQIAEERCPSHDQEGVLVPHMTMTQHRQLSPMSCRKYFPSNNDVCNKDTSTPQYQKMLSSNFHSSSKCYNSDTSGIDATPNANSSTVDVSSGHQSDSDRTNEKYRLHREWETIDSAAITGSVLQSVRIVSYNILSQKLLELNRYLYRKCNPHILPWDYRWEKLQAEIVQLNADILCLQEVEECHLNRDIAKFLDDHCYNFHYKRRTGNNKNKPDGVLIAFKRDLFEHLKSQKVEYWRGPFPPVNQDNVAVITLLKLRGEASVPNDSCLCIVNTHLLYNPKRGDIKLTQLSTLFAEVHDALASYGTRKVPILMCGDFNSLPKSHLYNFITRQRLHYKDLHSLYISGQKVKKGKSPLPARLLPQCLNIAANGCVKVKGGCSVDEPKFHLNHSLGRLLSSYCHDRRQASTTQDNGVTVDYIFHTPYEDCKDGVTINPRKRLSLIRPRSLAAVRGIPNAIHPSDHLPIVVDFDLVAPQSSSS